MFSRSYYCNYCHKIINENDRQHNMVICRTKNMSNINKFPNNDEKNDCLEPFSKMLQNENKINSLLSQNYPSKANEEFKTLNANSDIKLNDDNINNIPFSYKNDDNSEKEKSIFSGNNNIRLNSTNNNISNRHSNHKNINFNNFNPNQNRKKFSNRKNFRNNNYRYNNNYYNNYKNRRN